MAGRPGLQTALDLLASGQADVLVVSKLDRLSRSLLDFANLMARGQRERWSLVALDLGVDTSSPAGEFMASIMMSAAQWERRLAGQRTREALAVRRAQGLPMGRPPSIDPEIVDRIVTSYTSGNSMAEIARTLNAEGVPTARGRGTWYPSTIQTVLRRTTSTSAA
jgi:DNA invertase Pin-like site-specific DNA recombinase